MGAAQDDEAPGDEHPLLEVLFDEPGLPRSSMPNSLTRAYGGFFGIERPSTFANFVASTDGVVSLPAGSEPGKVISGGSRADRFVMGLLRAVADFVVVGANTFRRTPGHVWTPEAIYPPAAEAFRAFRERLGLEPEPTFVLVTGSGDIDTRRPALEHAIVATTPEGASALGGQLPSSARVVVHEGRVRFSDLFAELRGNASRSILTEGGPELFTELVRDHLVDELFLTLSPALFGRFDGDGRRALTAGIDLGRLPLELRSVRRDGSHLFTRYRVLSP